jgi:3-methyladenine DNA glycosylase/8-oxoguanine DNA glycosylase
MVANLVQAVGKPQPGNSEVIAFPTIAAVARASNELLAQARLGYRAPYIATFARQAMNGEIALEECNNPDLSTEELQKRLLSIKGVGNYAANTLLMLLGRYEHLAYDTAMRDFVGQKYFDGQQPTEEDALAIYDSWGRWKYLAYWFDIYSGG